MFVFFFQSSSETRLLQDEHRNGEKILLESRPGVSISGGNIVNPLLHKYSFWLINNRQLLKILWEKKKLLVTSNFSFSHNVVFPQSDNCTSFVHISGIIFLFVAELEKPKNGVSGNALTHSHTMTSLDAPGKQAFWKYCGKRRNCS